MSYWILRTTIPGDRRPYFAPRPDGLIDWSSYELEAQRFMSVTDALAEIDRRGFDPKLIRATEGTTPARVPATLGEALGPLAAIADAYDRNELDDELRRFWGEQNEHETSCPPDKLAVVSGRGGRTLLTLADCQRARAVLRALAGSGVGVR